MAITAWPTGFTEVNDGFNKSLSWALQPTCLLTSPVRPPTHHHEHGYFVSIYQFLMIVALFYQLLGSHGRLSAWKMQVPLTAEQLNGLAFCLR